MPTTECLVDYSVASSTALYARTQLAVLRSHVDRMFTSQIGLQCLLREPLADGSFLIVHSSDDTDANLFRAPRGTDFPQAPPRRSKPSSPGFRRMNLKTPSHGGSQASTRGTRSWSMWRCARRFARPASADTRLA